MKTKTRICTKREMIAGIAMEHAIIQRNLDTRTWKRKTDPDTGESIIVGGCYESEVDHPGDPTGDIAFCPEHSGMKALIERSGRVNLFMMRNGPLESFLDITVTGDTFEEICQKGILALHERVMQSGLKE